MNRMRDIKSDLLSYLDAMEGRNEHSIDQALASISRARTVCVFGMGAISYPIVEALRRLSSIRIDFVSDNDPAKWGKTFHGNLPCIPPQELTRFRDDLAVLIATQHYPAIRQQLHDAGIDNVFVVTEYRLLNSLFFKQPGSIPLIKQGVASLCDLLADQPSKDVLSVLVHNWFDFDVSSPGYRDIFEPDQYYPADLVSLGQDEAFVDVGAYNGDTLLDFVRRTAGRFRAIHAFELDAANFAALQAAADRLPQSVRERISLYPMGLWDEEREVGYETGGSGSQSSCVDVTAACSLKGTVKRLDDVLGDLPVTFLKMDIEGAEPEALRGAAGIIRRQKPKLAVCVYHRPEHLWGIPLLLEQMVPDYRLYLRHHTPLEYETVCYALPG